jgi:hypothetical protein
LKTFTVRIEGVSPLLINRFKEQDEIPQTMKKSGKKDYGTPREQAEATAYCDEETKLCWVPSAWVKGAITTVSSDYKLPSSRKSVKSVIGGSIIPLEEKLYFVEGYKLSDIEVDSRPCVIQRSRIMRHRSRLEKWSLEFHLQIEDTILEPDNVHQMLVDCGRRAGIGDFRASKGGPFGRFSVTSWKQLRD